MSRFTPHGAPKTAASSPLHRYTHVPPPLYGLCRHTANTSMQEAFGKRPFEWQIECIVHLLLMTPLLAFPVPQPSFALRRGVASC